MTEKPLKIKKSTKICKNSLSANEICSILRACAETKIRRLHYAGLEVVFDGGIYIPEARTKDLPMGKLDRYEFGSIREQEALKSAAEKLRDDETSQLLINDPVEYERMILAEQLDQGGPEGEETRVD